MEENCRYGYGVSIQSDEKVLEIVMMVTQTL